MAGARIGWCDMNRGTKIVIALIIVASVFAGVTLYAESALRQAFQRQLLVVRATDVVTSNAPAGTLITADFGPHCARAQFAQSGALIVQSDAIPAGATGVVYIRYEPDATFTSTGGDRVALRFFTAAVPRVDVVSVVDNGTVLFPMENRNSTLFVGGTGFGAGQAYQAMFTTPVTVGPDTWTVREDYTVTSLGFTTVTVQPPQACA